jgi:hypothetical protein
MIQIGAGVAPVDLRDERALLTFDLGLGDDVVVDLGDDLLDHLAVSGERDGERDAHECQP